MNLHSADMFCHHSPYQRSQSGTQRKVVGRAGGALQRELQSSELGSSFEVRFNAQSPEATLSNTQASTLEQLMRSITGNKSLILDKGKKRLYPIVTLDNPSHNASVTVFLRQPTMYTATLHIAGCNQSVVDAAILDLSSITGSPGSCRVSPQGRGMYSLMGRYSCTMYDLIRNRCNECTMKVSMVSVGESAICAYFRKEHQMSLLTLSFECMQMIVSQKANVLHVDRCTTDSGDRLDIRARNEESKGTKLSLFPDGYVKGAGRLDLLTVTCDRVNEGLMEILSSKRCQKFLDMMIVSPANL